MTTHPSLDTLITDLEVTLERTTTTNDAEASVRRAAAAVVHAYRAHSAERTEVDLTAHVTQAIQGQETLQHVISWRTKPDLHTNQPTEET